MIRIERPVLHFGPDKNAGWWVGASVMTVCDERPLMLRLFGVSVGWGWDADVPLRPWPAVGPRVRTAMWGGCFAWFGFFVTLNLARVDGREVVL